MPRFLFPAALSLFLAAAPALATDSDLRSVAGMAQHNRVVLVFSPTLRDPRLQTQRQIMARFAAGAAARDLILVQVSEGRVIGAHDNHPKLRRRFDTPAPRYRTLLLGKDGKVAIDAAGPIDEPHLKAAIDAMPMRREEVRRAKAGEGRAED
ncbi:DUF4174 domain-containing protein [Sphingomonas sp. AP4-R1]|uniref:DUF4174 domain-containing protein n=1 Tax=Sphingomonas sp. AP4-R1 TaxID=2735134 RepID=UPI001493D36B|nr:DUF4174 domain-containing protein [Sphingomonas sp. AP4-R1]QJU59470.1 DUF4174 domain-containing protein [Sphingomonas sp. AP4-R1]